MSGILVKLPPGFGPSMDHIEGDRSVISQTIDRIGIYIKQFDAARLYVSIGSAYSDMKRGLIGNKNKPGRIGWAKAFKTSDGKAFFCSRQQADRYIEVHDVFHQWTNDDLPWQKMPQSFHALFVLAGFIKTKERNGLTLSQLKTCLDKGSIRYDSSNTDINAVAVEYGLKKKASGQKRSSKQPTTKQKQEKEASVKNLPLKQRVAMVFETFAEMKVSYKQFFEELGLDKELEQLGIGLKADGTPYRLKVVLKGDGTSQTEKSDKKENV